MSIKVGNIRIISENGAIVFSGIVTELPLKEEYIIEQSLEWFNDSEPCIIHRTYVAKKFYIQFYEKLLNFKKNGINEVLCCDINELIKNININALDTNLGKAYMVNSYISIN